MKYYCVRFINGDKNKVDMPMRHWANISYILPWWGVVKGQTVNESQGCIEEQRQQLQTELHVRLRASCFCQIKSTYSHALAMQINSRSQYCTTKKVVALLKLKTHARSSEHCVLFAFNIMNTYTCRVESMHLENFSICSVIFWTWK